MNDKDGKGEEVMKGGENLPPLQTKAEHQEGLAYLQNFAPTTNRTAQVVNALNLLIDAMPEDGGPGLPANS